MWENPVAPRPHLTRGVILTAYQLTCYDFYNALCNTQQGYVNDD